MFFCVLDSSLLPVESNPRHDTYNWGGAAQPKVTVLTVMCQQDSRPELQAGTLFTSTQPLSPSPAVPGYSSQFFFWSDALPFYVCPIQASVVAKKANCLRASVFAAGLSNKQKKGKKNRRRDVEEKTPQARGEHANVPHVQRTWADIKSGIWIWTVLTTAPQEIGLLTRNPECYRKLNCCNEI